MNTRASDFHIQGPQIHQFTNIMPKPVPRSAFRRDFTRRSTFNSDLLIPIFVDEILPGDDVHIDMTAMVRMTTPIKPLMDNLYFETFWFFVPNRLVWTHWENFQGQQVGTAPIGLTAYTVPVLDYTKAPLSTTGFLNQSMSDYFGLPTYVTAAAGSNMAKISCLFHRAYNLIYNEWFRDENLITPVTVNTGDGPDDPALYTNCYPRNKRKDYFTSCLPFAQKGNPITLPLGTYAPVRGIGFLAGGWVAGPSMPIYETGGSPGTVTYANYQSTSAAYAEEDPGAAGYPHIWADLSTATSASLNALRQSALYQQILELDARGGTRYVESLFSRFGVISPDFRLQRPELCGLGQSRINIYSVPQTQGTGASGTSTPQGNLAAFSATPVVGNHTCRYSATEHGMLIGIGNVRADLTYQQGLPKMFNRSTRLDFYEPLLNGLGEQAVLESEIYASGNATNENTVFGYQERFAEYRFKNSEITGVFRSNDPLTLQVWHLSESFAANPPLSGSWIQSSTPMDRVLAVSTANAPNFLMDAFFKYNHVRPMPIRSNPGIAKL